MISSDDAWPGGTVQKSSSSEHWRADFPVLDQHVNGYPLAYLDSAATTHRPRQVLAAIDGFYESDNANPGSTLHTLARRAHERYEVARSTIAQFLNAAESEEIVWTRGTTEGVNLVSTAWARPLLRKGDELLLTAAEHASNLLPWRLVAEQTGAKVRYVDVDDEGRVLLEDLDRKLSERTRLLAFSHISNVTGYMNPAREMCARAHRAGAVVLIDAAQSAPHVALDVRALGCDFLVFSSHKMLGPMGTGVLWARRELLESMPPYQAGSNMAHEVDFQSQEYEHTARKFGAGTPNVAGAVGLAAAVQYLRSRGRDAIEAYESELTRYALDRLTKIPGLRLLGPRLPSGRIPVFSFVLEKYTAQDVLRHLDSRGIAIRAGDLAALPLLKRFGVTSAARASCYLYTQASDVDRLSSALQELTRTRAQEPQ
ncbi:MAG: aminotransferase class V-fold PLP-dependent enzyme [Steroidobacteraceae bacterium]